MVLSWTPPADNGADDHGLHRVVDPRRLREAVRRHHVHARRAHQQRRVQLHRDRDEPRRRLRPVARRPRRRVPTPAPTPRHRRRSRSATGACNVAWVTPTTPGSPVESFTLEISPAPPSGIGQKTGVTGNSMVWDGLENGVALPGARAGAQPRARPVELERRGPPPRSPRVLPSRRRRRAWRACSRWATRRSCRSRGSSPPPTAPTSRATSCRCCRAAAWCAPSRTSPPGSSRRPCRVTTSTVDYTFRVRASNKAGWGEWGATSSPRRAFGEPGAPSAVSAQPGDRSLTVSYSPAAGNGATGGELRYEYSLNGGGWTALPGNNVIGGLNNGTSYQVALRAYTALDGVRYDGPASAPSAAQIPYGPVGTPGRDGDPERPRHHLLVERAGAERPRPSPRCRSASTAAAGRTSRTAARAPTPTRYSTTHTIDVRAQDAAGQWSARQVGVGHDGRSAAAARVGDARAPRSDRTTAAPRLVRLLRAEHPGLPGGQLSRLLRERSRRRVRRRRAALASPPTDPSSSAATSASRARRCGCASRAGATSEHTWTSAALDERQIGRERT